MSRLHTRNFYKPHTGEIYGLSELFQTLVFTVRQIDFPTFVKEQSERGFGST